MQNKLPLINSAHGSDTRNIINEIIKTINDRGLEILSESGFLTWLDENGIKHREEVSTFNDLPANDSLNTVRGVENENKIYIKKENGWVRFQTIDINKINDVENRVYDNLNVRGILATDPPIPYVAAKGDGVTDDSQAINNLLQNFHEVYLPPLDYVVKDTIKIGRSGKALIGLSENVRGFTETATLIYDGPINRKKTVVLIGQNDVGVEPVSDGTNNTFKNIKVDANYKAGFCVYGTYITNESKIENIVAEKSLEYNYYLAKSWYATFLNLVSLKCKGKGIALGMPLEYQSGEKVTWTSNFPLEMNNTKINNIRSIQSGEYYSQDNVGTYTPDSEDHRRHGYGIGAGLGNGFRLDNFVSELSGGVNLYIYTGSQPSKNISNGYLENGAYKSGLNASTNMPNMIIENTSVDGGAYEVSDIFMNYSSGGIYHLGSERIVKIKNIHQPRFLKSLDGISAEKLFQFILKDNVYYQAGFTNSLESLSKNVEIKTLNTRYESTMKMELKQYPGHYNYIYFKSTGDIPYGGYSIRRNGEVYDYPFPNNLIEGEWVYSRVVGGSVDQISKNGGTGDTDSFIDIKIVTMPPTHI